VVKNGRERQETDKRRKATEIRPGRGQSRRQAGNRAARAMRANIFSLTNYYRVTQTLFAVVKLRSQRRCCD
jgi:hypothetical protein